METYSEFLKRINSFEKSELSLGLGDFKPNPSVLKKVDTNNCFNKFYGDTVVFDLALCDKEKVTNIVNELYKMHLIVSVKGLFQTHFIYE